MKGDVLKGRVTNIEELKLNLKNMKWNVYQDKIVLWPYYLINFQFT